MAFQEAKGGNTWNGKDLKVNDVVEGFYIGSHSYTSNYYGQEKENIVYELLCEDDVQMQVKGTADIKRKFQSIPVGCLVRITYLGEKRTERGNNMKEYKVEFDSDTKTEVK